MKSGLLTENVNEEIFFKSLAASALHEIAKIASLDASVLMCHQMAADICYREDEDIPVEKDAEGLYVPYDPEEEEDLKRTFMDIAMKFHIFDKEGLGAKVTPIIENMYSHQRNTIDDPFLRLVIEGSKRFAKDLTSMDLAGVVKTIQNIAVPDDVSEQYIMSKNVEEIELAIYEDDTVQCTCDFCERFFQIIDRVDDIDIDSLNPLQQIMADKYDFKTC